MATGFKFFYLALLGLLVIPAEGWASRARVMVMGTGDPTAVWLDSRGNTGSPFYDDPYNVFLNPALVNDIVNYAVVEKSNDPGLSASGGFFRKFGTLNAGAYFNRFSGLFALKYGTLFNLHRPVEVFVGGGSADLQWGVGSSFSYVDDGDLEQRNTRLNLGLRWGRWEPFVEFSVGKIWDVVASTTNQDYGAGLRYKNKGFKAWVLYKRVNTNPDSDTEIDSFGLGAAHRVQINGLLDFYYSAGFWRVSSDNINIIPFYMALESPLLSWLELRAGLHHDIYYSQQGQSSANENTSGRLGLSLIKAPLTLDWALGYNLHRLGQGAPNGPNFENVSDVDTQTLGLASGFFTALSLNARWE